MGVLAGARIVGRGGARLLGVSRPTLVAWLEAGRIPFRWRGAHRRVHRFGVLAYRARICEPHSR